MSYTKHCEIKNTYERKELEWKIDNFFLVFGSTDQVEHESPPFFLGNVTWFAYLVRINGHNFWSMFVVTPDDLDDNDCVFEVECNLGFKKVDGSWDESLLLTDNEKYDGYYKIYSFTECELMERKHEFTTSDSLTIMCSMKYGTSQPQFDQPTPMKLSGLDTLSEKLKNMFTNKDSCDVILQVKNKIFHAHKAILIARSSVFSDMFDSDKDKETCTVNMPDCDPGTFHKFLQYLYCGKLEDISFQEVLHLYSTSSKFNVKELKYFCVQYMAQFLTVDNVCDILMLAEKNDEVKLLCLAQRFCHKNSSKIVNTPKWKSLLTNNSELVSKLATELTSKVKV